MKKHYIKRLFATVAVLLCCITANAHDFEVDGIYYKILSLEDLTVEVTYKGDNYSSYDEYTGDVIIPSTVTYKSKSLTVTSIGYRAFYGCDGLTNVVIGNSVTSIGNLAFYECSGLTNVVIDNSVTSIGYEAFYDCDGLTSVVIGNSVTSIGDYAFYNCKCLTSITIPNSVTIIGRSAFYGCSGLTNVVIGNSVTSIGERVFYDCDGLTSITIPNSVTTIGGYAFEDCDGLKSITIPNSVTSIGESAFSSCSGLTSITIPNSVIIIGYEAFAYCDGLTSITIPNSVISIGNDAFAGCSKIKKVELDCTTIGSWFSGNSSIEEIVLGDNVTSIGNSAFNGCSGITNISLKCTTPPTVGSNNFTNAHYINVTVNVPQGAIEAYQAADVWKKFWDIQEQGATDEPDTETKKCATPVIGYENGTLTMTSATEGVKFITEIKNSDVAMYYDGRIELTATYNISVYAMLEGFENSDIATATLCWVENGGSDEDDTTNIITVPAVAVLVTSANGAVTVSCSLEGETVTVYTTDGTAIGTAVIANGSTTIQSGLSKGSVAIVKIGNKSVKVVVD